MTEWERAMHRIDILDALAGYQEVWSYAARNGAPYVEATETAVLKRFVEFIRATPSAFERATLAGHLTGSAVVVSTDLTRVLLTLHGKLNKWLQLGGHADGHPHLHDVAMREAEEESGLSRLKFLPFGQAICGGSTTLTDILSRPLPMDLDCHDIPARPGEPTHVHYDVRYLIVADANQPLVISEESKDLRWFSIEEARRVAPEASTLRQFDKLDWLRPRLTGGGKVLG